jgi:hypothetical protein
MPCCSLAVCLFCSQLQQQVAEKDQIIQQLVSSRQQQAADGMQEGSLELG